MAATINERIALYGIRFTSQYRMASVKISLIAISFEVQPGQPPCNPLVCRRAAWKPDCWRAWPTAALGVRRAHHRSLGMCRRERTSRKPRKTCIRTSRCELPWSRAEGPCRSTRSLVSVEAWCSPGSRHLRQWLTMYGFLEANHDVFAIVAFELPNSPLQIPAHELRVPIDPVQGARHDVLLLRVDRPGERFHPGWHPIRPHSRPRRHPPRCLHHFINHPAKENGVGPSEVVGRVTMQLFVRDDCTMITAPVQCDVDGIPKGLHWRS